MDLALRVGGEIVSVDSMQVYRGMDIGTAKPDLAVRRRVTHHLIDLVDPSDELTVGDFRRRGLPVLDRLARAGTPAVVSGGSGLHFRSLVDPMSMAPSDPVVRAALEATPPPDLAVELLAADPHAGGHVDLANPRRVLRAVEILRLTGVTPSQRAQTTEYRDLRNYRPERAFVAVGVDPGDAMADRVTARFDAMIDTGLLDEVAALAPRLGRTARHAVGYAQLLPVVAGEVAPAAGREAAIRATLSLVKRQRTFFRRDPRLRWISWHDDPAERLSRALDVLEQEPAWIS